MVQHSSLSDLAGLRIGLDATYWLRTIQMLKDPFADAIGGAPPCMFETIDRELQQLQRAKIHPVFVFEGMAPQLQHQNFQQQVGSQQLDAAWTCLANGQRHEAQKAFAVATSRINGDIIDFVFHHLKSNNYEVFRAPYFTGPQLSHFQDAQLLHCAFGPPGLLLYGVSKIIINLDFHSESFEWVDLNLVLNHWKGLTKERFIDACLLAGTEYCLTYPYLNLEPFSQAGANFQFNVAVDFIRQYSLVNWMQTIQPPHLNKVYLEDCGICKVLVQHSPIFDVRSMSVKPVSATKPHEECGECPSDFQRVMGSKLPAKLYTLVCTGLLTPWMPMCLASGEWSDRQAPLVDSFEYRQLLDDLQEYREKALGLLAMHLDPAFSRPVQMRAFWEARKDPQQPQPPPAAAPPAFQPIMPRKTPACCVWNFSRQALEQEMRRQGQKEVTLRFCLQWHAYEFERNPSLSMIEPGGERSPKKRELTDTKHLAAYVHFMMLQQIGLIGEAPAVDMTVLGDALKDCPEHFQEPCLVALEMMKFGLLTGEAFEPLQDKPFPSAINYPARSEPTQSYVMLISRVVSLVPMRLRSDMWNSEVDFDLAAFHCQVRLLKRSLRQLTEASLAFLLMEDHSRMHFVPDWSLNPVEAGGAEKNSKRAQQQQDNRSVLPTFTLPRACMGIVLKSILNSDLQANEVSNYLRKNFQACAAAREDLQLGFQFWEECLRCVEQIAGPLGAQSLQQDMRAANDYLMHRRRQLNL